MARCTLAQGCKSIDWFMFHDRDCWGDAPVSSHAYVRPSHQVLKETPNLLFNKIKAWDGLVPQDKAEEESLQSIARVGGVDVRRATLDESVKKNMRAFRKAAAES